MARREGEKPLQISVMPKTIKALRQAASALYEEVERDRAMSSGPMMAYVARWFLSLSIESQSRIIQEGAILANADNPTVDIEPHGDITISFHHHPPAKRGVRAPAHAIAAADQAAESLVLREEDDLPPIKSVEGDIDPSGKHRKPVRAVKNSPRSRK